MSGSLRVHQRRRAGRALKKGCRHGTAESAQQQIDPSDVMMLIQEAGSALVRCSMPCSFRMAAI